MITRRNISNSALVAFLELITIAGCFRIPRIVENRFLISLEPINFDSFQKVFRVGVVEWKLSAKGC